MTCSRTAKSAREDVPRICSFPQSDEELYFLFPKATYPLTPEQLGRAIEQRYDSTVVLLDGQVCGFANFYVRAVSGTCAIGNVVVDPEARARGVGRYLIDAMARKALQPPPLIESRVLLARVPGRIAEHRRCTECVAARLMGVPVYPERRLPLLDQLLHVAHEEDVGRVARVRLGHAPR